MAGALVYMVCSQDDLDPATGACAHVQYVQAPLLIPPLSAQAGAELSIAILGVWVIGFVFKTLMSK